jgi:hypothetical protein
MEDMQRLQATQIRVEAQVLKSTLDTFFSKYLKKRISKVLEVTELADAKQKNRKS